MQKYVLVQLLEDMQPGTQFAATDWPLHMTLVSNFAVDWESTDLFSQLSSLISGYQPIEIIAGSSAYFGPQQQVHVILLDLSPELQALHNDTVRLLEAANAVFDEPQYLKDGYRPHATVQSDKYLSKGDVVSIQAITLIDMWPNGDISQRKVLQTIPLANKA